MPSTQRSWRGTTTHAAATTPTPSRRPSDHGDARPQARGAEPTAAPARTPQGDPARPRLRDDTIEAWLPMTRRLARRYAGRGEPLDDLVQAATVGLIKAIDRFDAEVGVDFTVFAIPTILGEIKRHFRDRAWAIRVPRRLQEMRMAISDAGTVLAHKLGRAPTVTDIAAHLKVSEEEVLEGLEGAQIGRASCR